MTSTPDLWLLLTAGLVLVAVASIARARGNAAGQRVAARGHNPAPGNDAPSTLDPSMPSQPSRSP